MFTKDVRKLTDDEVEDQRSNLSKQIDKITSTTKLINELLESTNPVTETKVDDNSKIAMFLQSIKRLNQQNLHNWHCVKYRTFT